MKKKRDGFTLVEMLVVITIISLLMGLIVVLIKGAGERARNTKTHSVIRTMDMACASYQVDFKVWPSDTTFPGGGSKNLHHHLGRPYNIASSYNNDGTPASIINKKPYMDFPKDWLKTPSADPVTSPSAVVDAWLNDITFALTGTPPAPDIVSWGKDGQVATVEDNISNKIRDY